jgi:hypothetical protein
MSTNLPGSIVNFMIVSKHPDPEELMLYAMDFLTPEEAAPLALHLNSCLVCRQELGDIQAELAAYAHTVEMHAPPPQLRQRVLKQVAREKKVIPIAAHVLPQHQPAIAGYGRNSSLFSAAEDEEERPQRNPVLTILGWSGWAIAAGLTFAIFMVGKDRENLRSTLAAQNSQVSHLTANSVSAQQVVETLSSPTAMRVTLSAKPVPPGPTGRIAYDPAKGSLVFLAAKLDPIQLYKTYELWVIPAAPNASPVPAGTFRPDVNGNASVIMPEIPKGVDAKAFGVTIEDAGGSNTPTKPIIMAGD